MKTFIRNSHFFLYSVSSATLNLTRQEHTARKLQRILTRCSCESPKLITTNICLSCGIGLKQWEENDDPMKHEK